MLTKGQAEKILRNLKTLPSEKVEEVLDFTVFLKQHYGNEKTIDERDYWTDEDIRDLTLSVLNRTV